MPALAKSPAQRLCQLATAAASEREAGTTTAQRLYDLACRVHREAMTAHRRGRDDEAEFFRGVSEALRKQADATAA